ncbi:MAG: glycosyltransferase [Candidatus Magasanikbacteria bacterium]
MKFVILNSDYPVFIESVAKQDTSFLSVTYDEQTKIYFDKFFGTANFYSKNLCLLGHEAQDFVINNQYLQKKWLVDHDLSYNKILELFDKNRILRTLKRKFYFSSDWYYKAILAQIKEYRPDVIYIQLMAHISPVFLKKIKKYCKLLVGQIACPMPSLNYFKDYDLILSSLPNYVEKFKKAGIKSEYFKLGFEKEVLNNLSKKDNFFDVVHIGGYGPVHNERNALLEKVSKIVPIDFWGYGVNNLSSESPIRKKIHGESWGVNMFETLYNSKITMTKHIDSVAGEYANNMTLFEATGVGTLLITDEKKNLSELFKIGEEVVTYKNAEDLADKIKYYLDHEEERKKIALAGQRRTLTEHTYTNRMQELIKIIENYL